MGRVPGRTRPVPPPLPRFPAAAVRERPLPRHRRPASARGLARGGAGGPARVLRRAPLDALRSGDDRGRAGPRVGAAQALLHRLLDGGVGAADGAGVGPAVSRPARRRHPRRPARAHAHRGCSEAGRAGRVRRRLRHGREHPGLRALPAGRRRPAPVRRRRPLPARALRRHRLRRRPGVPGPRLGAGGPGPRPAPAAPAAGVDARAASRCRRRWGRTGSFA